MIQTQSANDLYKAALEQVEQRAAGNGQAWFNDTRKTAMARFGELGVPTTRHEEWHYTNLAPLAKTPFALAAGTETVDASDIRPWQFENVACRIVLVNGHFVAGLSQVAALQDGIRVCSLAEAIERDRDVVEAHLARHVRFDNDALTALNTALFGDGVFIHVPRGVVLEQPIEIIHLAAPAGEPLMSHPRNLIVLQESSQATVLETFASVHDGPYFTNTVTEAYIADNAVLDHYKLVRENEAAFHVGNLWLQQGRSCNATHHVISLGGGLVRNDINAILNGEGSDCTLNGLTMLEGDQHVDNHLSVEHAKPHCTSWEYYKGIYDDRSHGVFSGRILVHKDAQKTDAKQTNMSLLLSNQALADSKPQLEIFADDVKCTHGATIGQIDETAVFYLRSRGLCKAAARSLLIYAFAGETLNAVRFEPLRLRLEQEILNRLPQGELMLEAS